MLDPEPTEALRTELAWLGAVLGPARDLDVLIEYFAATPEAAGLVESLTDRRVQARAVLVAALSSERYYGLLDTLARFSHEPPRGEGADELAAIWWGEAKRLRRHVETLGDDPTDEALHAVRIRVKRARYAAELAGHELGKRGMRYITKAKAAQDVLGGHQDAFVAEHEIREWWAGRTELDTTAAGLVDRERTRRLEARRAWPEAWKKLDRAARRARP